MSVSLAKCLALLVIAAVSVCANPEPPSPLGIGFLWTAQSEQVAGKLTGERDFVDLLVTPGRFDVFEKVKAPVKISCIALSLEKNEGRPFAGLKEMIETLQKAGIPRERVTLAYNPERSPGTTKAEMDDLLASARRAQTMAKEYGAPLIIGPGLREMMEREDLYPELAKCCDVWLIQSQRLQLDLETRKPVPLAQYREKVKQIVNRLRQGNPKIRIIVQVVTTAERQKTVLTAEQVVAFARSVEGIVDAVRIYGAKAELLNQVIDCLRPQRPDPATPVSPAGVSGPVNETIAIPMRDGQTLAADLFLPSGFSKAKPPQGVPVILICTPYDKNKENVSSWRDCFLRNDYAVVVEDMRGFYGSAAAGRGTSRHYDGYDTIEWLAKQPWCNGKVGMIGFSHLGAAQYESAITAPPHLACAIPAQAPGNYYTDAFYPEKFRKADMETIFRGPITSRTTQLISRRIRSHNTSDIGKFNTPMLHNAGWFDFYKEGAIEMFRACQQQGGPGARGNHKLLIGPWGHGMIQEEDLGKPLKLDGGRVFPANSKPDWEKDIWLPWFDHWQKGKPTGVMNRPAVRYYLMGSDEPNAPGNRWIEADDFPPKSTTVAYYAHADRTLRTEPPTAEKDSIAYIYDPQDPVPTVGRRHAMLPVKGPHDQREVEGRPDVVLFTTPKLAAPLSIVGQIRVKLWASTDRKDTDFTAKLTDVYPDGRSMLILDGIVKGRFRNTYRKEELLTPGEVYEFDMDLGYTAIVLAPGHRLRLAISSSNFDRFDINPNTGEPYGDHAVTRTLLAKRLRGYQARGKPEYTATLPAKNVIHLNCQHPTQVILPIQPL